MGHHIEEIEEFRIGFSKARIWYHAWETYKCKRRIFYEITIQFDEKF